MIASLAPARPLSGAQTMSRKYQYGNSLHVYVRVNTIVTRGPQQRGKAPGSSGPG